MASFQLFFSVQGTDGSPTGPDPKKGCVIKTLETQAGQFLLGCKCPVSRGIVVQEQDPLGRVDRVVLWKIINEEDAVLIPKNRGENFSSRFLHPLCRHCIDCCFVSGS